MGLLDLLLMLTNGLQQVCDRTCFPSALILFVLHNNVYAITV
jgi:hypothetical protein